MVLCWLPVCLSACSQSIRLSVFSFLDDNLSKCRQIIAKLFVCIDIVELWFGIVNGKISTVFWQSYLPEIIPYFFFHFWMINLVNINGFSLTWFVHWYCGDLVWDCWWANFVSFWQRSVLWYFHFWTIALVNINGFSPNLICALILLRSALGLLMGKFSLFLTELSACNTSVFYFQDNNLSKFQWIFTKFDMYVYIVKICFGIADLQILSIFDSYR